MTDPKETIAAIAMAKAAIEKRERQLVTAIVLELFRRLVLKTPVDSGRARMNWNIGVGEADLSVTDATTRGVPMQKALGALGSWILGQPIFITNNLPYIRVLEFGLYPDPVKLGTYVKGIGYVKKSEHGYSKQAPVGMVGVTIAELSAAIPGLAGTMAMTGA